MPRTPAWRRYLRFWGPDPRADVDDEFRFHLDTEIDELIAGGLSPDEARAEALRKFGDVSRFGRDCQASDARRAARTRRSEAADVLRQDLRQSIRALYRQPAFALIAVATLGLGIGANTAVFSVVNGVLLSPLAYRDPERLVLLWESVPDMPQILVSYPNYLDWRKQNRTFEDLAIYNGFRSFNLTGDGEPERLPGGLASGNLFSLLGAEPVVGRLIGPSDDQLGAEAVAVLSDGFWRRRFGADPRVVGRAIRLDGKSYQVIGVLQPRIELADAEVWIPIAPLTNTPEFARANHPGTLVVGRLRRGVTLDQMRADLARVTKQLQEEFPKANAGVGANGAPLMEIASRGMKPALLMLAGAVALVLLVACANVANLLLARATSRQKEFALRSAMGASRGRILRQLLTESVVLALLGGTLGVALAWGGVKLLLALQPGNVPRLTEIGIDGTVLGFAVAISLLTGIGFGLFPAVQAARPAPLAALREEGRGGTASRSSQRLRAGLTVAEVAVALILLVGAGLLVRSFANLTRVDPGINPRNVIAALIRLPELRYPDSTRQRAAFAELLARVQAEPEVESAALTSDLPLQSGWQSGVSFEGLPPVASGRQPLLNGVLVSAGYFATMAIPIIAGRDFAAEDRAGQLPVVIVSQSVATRFFGAEKPIGRRMKVGPADSPGPWATIIAVVGEVKNDGLASLAPRGTMYFPAAQYAEGLDRFWVVVRSRAPPDRLGVMFRRDIAALDRELPVTVIRTIDQVIESSVAQPKFSTVMLTVFAAIALILAAVGLYGVISYGVSQRTREIGVRMALGARRTTVVMMVITQALMVTAVGIAVGAAVALAGGRIMGGLLFGVKPADPLVFLLVILGLGTVAMIAAAVPAVRASRIDPCDAMRGS
jgi:putative ABC transport system permease protein